MSGLDALNNLRLARGAVESFPAPQAQAAVASAPPVALGQTVPPSWPQPCSGLMLIAGALGSDAAS